jgi:hypothetical protein
MQKHILKLKEMHLENKFLGSKMKKSLEKNKEEINFIELFQITSRILVASRIGASKFLEILLNI